jgi:NAD(P)-dependent dehydrogenase (short-subunit alcohol dehydrogenase family)
VNDRRRFEGRTVLVTGSTGMAESAARAIGAEGGRLFVVSRTEEHARALAESLGARWTAADLSREDDAERAIAESVEALGRLDAVFNAAGGSARAMGDGPLHEMSLEGWEAALATNATSQFLVCRAAVQQMLVQDPGTDGQRGAILNMSSVLAASPSPAHFATHGYAASKGAIEAFSISIAAYYARSGIRVNCIAPGLVATPMSARAQSDPEIMAYLEEKQPLARGAIDPDDVTPTALYLLSADARMVTGQVVAVDAGWAISEGPNSRRA